MTSALCSIKNVFFSGSRVTTLLVSLLCLQSLLLLFLFGEVGRVYLKLGEEEGKHQVYKALLQEGTGDCQCAPCPFSGSNEVLNLIEIHKMFEKTNDRLERGLRAVEDKVKKYSSAFHGLFQKLKSHSGMASQGFP